MDRVGRELMAQVLVTAEIASRAVRVALERLAPKPNSMRTGWRHDENLLEAVREASAWAIGHKSCGGMGMVSLSLEEVALLKPFLPAATLDEQIGR